MTINKIICGILGAIAVVSTADASRFMPCRDSEYADKCVRLFKDIQLSSQENAVELVKIYMMEHDTKCEFIDADNAHIVGQDYVRCSLADGSLYEFEFDDYSESIDSTADYGYAKALCLIYGGEPEGISKERLLETAVGGLVAGSALAVVTGGGSIAGAVVSGMAASKILFNEATDGIYVTCNNVSKDTCEDMYDGNSMYSESKSKCVPTNKFNY